MTILINALLYTHTIHTENYAFFSLGYAEYSKHIKIIQRSKMASVTHFSNPQETAGDGLRITSPSFWYEHRFALSIV